MLTLHNAEHCGAFNTSGARRAHRCTGYVFGWNQSLLPLASDFSILNLGIIKIIARNMNVIINTLRPISRPSSIDSDTPNIIEHTNGIANVRPKT